ncbi:MAG: VWA domain-containing protein [Acidobacteria bacterium]|nr:VWA domain-containing protein [Acidobacteriota bacterium]
MRFLRVACLLTVALPAVGLWAQDVRTNIQSGELVFTADTREVVLHVTVVDRRDRLVTDLGQTNFRILENGQPVNIKFFRQEEVPVSIGILVDNSGSMRDKRLRVNAAALEFVKASNPEDEMFIVNFNDEAYRDTDYTNDQARIQDALQRIDSRGGTALYDAVRASLDYLTEKAHNEKRVLLLISDGEDNASKAELEVLVRELQEAGSSQTSIYAIGLLTEEEKRSAKRAERAIKYLTRATGGPAYFPATVDEVTALMTQIAADIRNQYTIAYSPATVAGAGFREIAIDLVGTDKRNTVRHRPGYFGE